ncbi:Stk1 family PASTA domain-containing Ser/Thr kinase [uncultured Ruthenibacterium sp.]|uniref:Stk1 family PASTA domain-containing Ser/Thr kinase n=1 Tax=uncultured Ruthenibacterium sp. TaxID=1905347 RepID=UPI00349EBF4A
MDNLINQRLDGRYMIEQLLGSGGMANVYKGHDLQTGRTVAIKVLREEFLENTDLVRRFKNESKAISVLDHPNIVKVYDVNMTGNVQYIVMEYIDGITLKEYMEYRAQPLTYKETLHFVTQVLLALHHAHEKGIVHRDVKPQNIMLLSNGSIKVMDFGIARFSRSESQTMTDKAIGSVHYISPEQARGDTTDAKADIYSVGVMMYEMLSGKLPFDSDSPVSVAIKQISDTPTPLRELNAAVPEALEAITNRAMAKDPRDRYPSARAMLADLEEFKRNPSVKFEYQYLNDPEPTRYVDKVVSKTTVKQPVRPQARKKTPAKKAGFFSSLTGKGNWKMALPILAGVAAAFAIGAIILVIVIFKSAPNQLFTQYEDVDLPNFTNMNVNDIINNDEYPFRFEVEEEYNSEKEAGVVYDQSPKAPKKVKENSIVTLRVSKGVQMQAVPDVVGMTRDEAQKALKDAGFSVRVKTQESTDVAEDIVLSTDPVANTQYETGQIVELVISRAHVENETTVPSILNMDVETARKTLQAAGLTLGTANEVENEAPAGTIIAQTPEAGSTLKKNKAVHYTVSTGLPVNTRNVVITFTDTNDGGVWTFTMDDGQVATATSIRGTAGSAVVSFTSTGVHTIIVTGPDGATVQTLSIDFTSNGGDVQAGPYSGSAIPGDTGTSSSSSIPSSSTAPPPSSSSSEQSSSIVTGG